MEIKDKREKEEVPSGIRLMLLLKERLVEIMDREPKLNTPVLHGSLLGSVRAFGLPAASCVPG